MKYYKVKPQYDQRPKNRHVRCSDFYIMNELYTESEVKKQNLNMHYMEVVTISKNNTFTFMGARFEMEVLSCQL